MSETPLLKDSNSEGGGDQESKFRKSKNLQDLSRGKDLAATASLSGGERKKGVSDSKNGPVLPTREDASVAEELAADARALVDELRGSGSIFIDPAKAVARTAAAYAKSQDDREAATRLADALAIFNELFAVSKPTTISYKMSEVLHGSAKVLPGRHYLCRSANLDLKKAIQACSSENTPSHENKITKKASDGDVAPPRGRPLSARSLADTASDAKCSWTKRLRLAITPQEPLLPIQVPDDEAKLIEKRQILYGLALAAPVPLLTSAAGLQLFPGAWAFVAGAGIAVWIVTSCGMVLNQYGRLDWEKRAARALGRLGVLGAALMFSFYGYRAFFPSAPWGLVILIGAAVLGLGAPWAMSCIRGDDVIPGED
ncbi:hypothetical protein SETIT_5G412300v2 [Setaria italica]|uniref:Uncharacterized protein n=1 Tax=Setaria italica TaxID=4555 RepID=A0A368REA0_SETIT|nr:uncharacterized protein LOC111257214 [Setaria italica]RCV28539.1 hypothetical protein SETIT_5G412300v2 [Setaria italica]